MPHATARRSFHGPLLSTRAWPSPPKPKLGAVRTDRVKQAGPALELVPDPPSASSLGRVLLETARREQPSSNAHERVLAGVLSALKCLTGSRD